MAMGLLSGMTDYSHQSFKDILEDLKKEKEEALFFSKEILKDVGVSKKTSYWNDVVPFDFRSIVDYAVKYYDTTIKELDDIYIDLQYEVKEHHIKRLENIASVAHDINKRIGIIWHQKYEDKEYGTLDFRIVERIYNNTRDMAVNLLDISNMAFRLKDFIGKTDMNKTNNNPWISGSFYLFVIILVIILIAVLSKELPIVVLPIAAIASIFIVIVIGTLQLKNDDKITDKTFLSLMKEIGRQLPLIHNYSKRKINTN